MNGTRSLRDGHRNSTAVVLHPLLLPRLILIYIKAGKGKGPTPSWFALECGMLGRRYLRLGEALSRGLQRHVPSSCGRASSTQAAALAKSSAHYDLVIVGSGPAAQKCAIESAKYGKSVCIVDKSSQLGGVCVHTGTIPSKTFR